MNWIVYSVLMYISSVILYLALRKLQKNNVSNDISNTFMFSIGTLLFIVIALVNRENIAIEFQYILILLMITFFFSFLGNKFSLNGISQAPNPGYSLIIQKSYAIYTAIASIFLFSSELTPKTILAILIIIIFLGLMTLNKDKSNEKYSNKWIIFSFLAFFAFGSLALASKWLLNLGMTPFNRTFYVQLFVSIMFIIDLLIKLPKQNVLRSDLFNKSNYIWFLIIGLSNGLFNLFMQYAFQITPNVGYVNIINTASIAAITLLSSFIYKDNLDHKKIIGIIGITLGLILLIG